MLGDISSANKIYLVTGATDMRRSIDGLMAIIRDVYDLDPYSNAVFLFCGKRADRIKALHYEKDGFCLLYKRLEKSQGDTFHFQWPRNASEVRTLTRQQFRWLLEGLSIDQPKAIHPTTEKHDF
jgi:transposase